MLGPPLSHSVDPHPSNRLRELQRTVLLRIWSCLFRSPGSPPLTSPYTVGPATRLLPWRPSGRDVTTMDRSGPPLSHSVDPHPSNRLRELQRTVLLRIWSCLFRSPGSPPLTSPYTVGPATRLLPWRPSGRDVTTMDRSADSSCLFGVRAHACFPSAQANFFQEPCEMAVTGLSSVTRAAQALSQRHPTGSQILLRRPQEARRGLSAVCLRKELHSPHTDHQEYRSLLVAGRLALGVNNVLLLPISNRAQFLHDQSNFTSPTALLQFLENQSVGHRHALVCGDGRRSWSHVWILPPELNPCQRRCFGDQAGFRSSVLLLCKAARSDVWTLWCSLFRVRPACIDGILPASFPALCFTSSYTACFFTCCISSSRAFRIKTRSNHPPFASSQNFPSRIELHACKINSTSLRRLRLFSTHEDRSIGHVTNLLDETLADLGVRSLTKSGPFHPTGNAWTVGEEACSFPVPPASGVTDCVEDNIFLTAE